MKNKIAYFMEKDTRLVVDNLSKVIISANERLVKYTILRRSLKDEEIIVVNYIKNKRMIIYDELKKYNSKVYEGFIEWAEDNGIKWYSIGDEKEEKE